MVDLLDSLGVGKRKKKKRDEILETSRASRSRAMPWPWLYTFPWWMLVLIVVGIWLGVKIITDDTYSTIFVQLREGILMSLRVTFLGYSFALIIGLTIGIIGAYPPKPKRGLVPGAISLVRLAIYNLATLYVQVMRGLPVLIVLLVAAFVIMPRVSDFLEESYGIELWFRNASWETATIALAMAYGAFLSETLRAGIQSIEKGQIEAARSVGLTGFQTMRFIILPQAIRRVLPPLGNDFIAMIKDSSLVSILGVRDVTQIGKVWSGSTFLFLETYLVVVTIYLTMTVTGSLLVRLLEWHLKLDKD